MNDAGGRPDPIPLERGMIQNLTERRGEFAVKQYVHWRGCYDRVDVFIKFRKKHNRSYEEVAYHQWLVDEIKPIFEIQQMGTRVVQSQVEGYGIMQRWHMNYGTLRQPEMRPYYASAANLVELLKIAFFDAIIGSLDRHGNNVIVLMDRTLLTIDDEDVFYFTPRQIVKFDRKIRRGMEQMYLQSAELMANYRQRVVARSQEILALADFPLMRLGRYLDVLECNLEDSEGLWDRIMGDLRR